MTLLNPTQNEKLTSVTLTFYQNYPNQTMALAIAYQLEIGKRALAKGFLLIAPISTTVLDRGW
jgi:hypothetical protein